MGVKGRPIKQLGHSDRGGPCFDQKMKRETDRERKHTRHWEKRERSVPALILLPLHSLFFIECSSSSEQLEGKRVSGNQNPALLKSSTATCSSVKAERQRGRCVQCSNTAIKMSSDNYVFTSVHRHD